ncbi:MAG: hypothetical protein NTX25_00210 [Proteobacteria bacterium]|nr:hypothetical protein [Pseudomonadota bacterium]
MSKLLKKLDKQMGKATPAPWQYFGDAGLYPPTYKDGDSDNSWFITTEDRHGDDAALIAALHRAYPKMKAVIEASKRMYDEWEEGRDSRDARFDYLQALAALEKEE